MWVPGLNSDHQALWKVPLFLVLCLVLENSLSSPLLIIGLCHINGEWAALGQAATITKLTLLEPALWHPWNSCWQTALASDAAWYLLKSHWLLPPGSTGTWGEVTSVLGVPTFSLAYQALWGNFHGKGNDKKLWAIVLCSIKRLSFIIVVAQRTPVSQGKPESESRFHIPESMDCVMLHFNHQFDTIYSHLGMESHWGIAYIRFACGCLCEALYWLTGRPAHCGWHIPQAGHPELHELRKQAECY